MFPQQLPGEWLCYSILAVPASIFLMLLAMKIGNSLSRKREITEYPIDEDVRKYIPYMNQDEE